MISHTAIPIAPSPALARLGYAALCVLLLLAVALETVQHGSGYWQIGTFGLAPELTLCFGVSNGLAKGQLHRRAVGAYNLMHRFWGPLALLVMVALGLIGFGFLIGALAWASHVALDRTVGYGLRTRDGYQRP